MKKTLTVNLNNIVFHIDDDAYDMLQTYLHEIADHFTDEAERREIMTDIEARIAELFSEKLQKNKNVINLEDVQEVIEIMGKPSQYTGEEDEEPKQTKSEKKQPSNRARRFYRDPENAILGGVSGGLSAYLNLDVTLIRILLVILVFVGVGFVIPVYIVIWFVAPEAITAAQRLEMQGEDVNVESIKTELNNARSYVQSDKFKQSAGHVGSRVGEVMQTIMRLVFGLLGALLGVVGVVLVGALLVLLVILIFEPSLMNTAAPEIFANWTVITPEKMVLLVISLILVVGCPIFLLVYWAIQLVTGKRSVSRTASLVVVVLWLAGLFMFYSIGAKTMLHLKNHDGNPITLNWSDDNSQSKKEFRSLESFHQVEVSGNIHLVLANDSTQKITVEAPTDILSKVITKVENGVLHVYTEGQIYLNRDITVTVSADSIQSIKGSGASQVSTEAPIRTANLYVELTGASKAEMDIDASGLVEMHLTGASQVDLNGKCSALKLEGTGACQVEAEELEAKTADVRMTGASHANVFASEKLDATALGASDIDCKGSPKVVNKNTHVGSDINVE